MALVTKCIRKTLTTMIVGTAVLLLIAPIAGRIGMGQAFAEDEKPQHAERKTRKTPTLNLKLHEKLQEAQEFNEKGDSAGALRLLDELRDPRKYDKYNSYERAMLWNFYAFIYYSQENYRKTIEAYENVLKQPDLPEALGVGTLYSLSQIYFVQENYSKAVQTLEKWFKVAENPGANAYILLGQGYYQLKDYNKAIPAVEKAIGIAREREKEVKENWYLLLRAMYYDKEDYKKTFEILRTLTHEYPKKEYYSQLAAMYGELKQEFNQYSTVAAMNDAKLLSKNAELVTYAQFLMQNDRPYRAAVILDEGMKNKIVEKTDRNYKLLGNAWTLAKEDKKAIPAFESAAKLSDTGDLYASLAQSYLNVEDWDKAINSVNKAFDKGKLKRPDTANVVLGMALFNLKKYDASLKAFEAAKKDKRSEKIARQWLRYVRGERDRAKALEKGLS
ncbi:MAG: tetratricopeptide repeat protein [Pseudomonadales bacterium]|nr:tetratricopeptide repeat protein [Pseudomonadales bacterium]